MALPTSPNTSLIVISKYGELGNGHFAHMLGIQGFYNPNAESQVL